MSREILDRFCTLFFQFDLYLGQFLELYSTQVNAKYLTSKFHFEIYAGRLKREYSICVK